MTKETFFAKSAMQSPNIQPGVVLAKMKGPQSLYFFIFCQPLGYFTWFVKVNHCLLKCFIIYYQRCSHKPSYFKVWAKTSWEHPVH